MALQRANAAEAIHTEAAAEDVLDAPAPAAEAPKTAVANTTSAPPTVVSVQGDVATKMAAAGFSGLHIDWTSFPTIVLDQGVFGTSDGNSLDISSFTARLLQSRKRYVYRTNVANDDDTELAYTYDPSEMDNPDSELSQKIAKWGEDGIEFSVKEYIEAVATVEDDECPLNGQMVLLQIPPTSTGRFSGYVTANTMTKGKLPSEYLTRFFKGEKVTKAKKPFHPWAFEYAG